MALLEPRLNIMGNVRLRPLSPYVVRKEIMNTIARILNPRAANQTLVEEIFRQVIDTQNNRFQVFFIRKFVFGEM